MLLSVKAIFTSPGPRVVRFVVSHGAGRGDSLAGLELRPGLYQQLGEQRGVSDRLVKMRLGGPNVLCQPLGLAL